jgi:hypothetical protein
MGKKDGALMLGWLFDLEQEDLVEGPPVLEIHAFIE